MSNELQRDPPKIGPQPRLAGESGGTSAWISPADPQELVDRRLRAVARKVKWVDLLAECGVVFSLLLAALFLGVICDHWLIQGGLSQGARIAAFCFLVGIAGGYGVYRIGPIVLRRVSPAFAAYMIEQGVPWLKNTLLNFVFLRAELGRDADKGKIQTEESPKSQRETSSEGASGREDSGATSWLSPQMDRPGLRGSRRPRDVTPRPAEQTGPSPAEEDLKRKILLSLGYTAAAQLARVPSHISVDYAPAIRAAYSVTILLAIGVLYLILSPKSLFVSVVRITNPWASLPAPTRVIIREVRPGDTSVEQGSSVQVTAEVRGLRRGESVLLYYRTADGRLGGQTIIMQRLVGYRFEAELPEGKQGLSGDLLYWIEAGDGRSPAFYLRVLPPVSVAVRQVRVRPPAYTGIPETILPGGGDLQVLEGSGIHMEVEASEVLAELSLLGAAVPGGRLVLHPQANLIWGLNFTVPQFSRARLGPEVWDCRFVGRTPEGRRLREELRWRLEIIPDRPPEVLVSGFPSEEAHVPVDSKLQLHVEAADTDFGLRQVQWCIGRAGATFFTKNLLNRPSPDPPVQGRWKSLVQISPVELGLKSGDRLQVWVRAADSREPEPNWAESARFILVVTPSAKEQVPQPKDILAGSEPQSGVRSEGSASRGNEVALQDTSPGMDHGTEPTSEKPEGLTTTGKPQEGVNRPSTRSDEETGEVFELKPLDRSPRLAQAQVGETEEQPAGPLGDRPTGTQNLEQTPGQSSTLGGDSAQVSSADRPGDLGQHSQPSPDRSQEAGTPRDRNDRLPQEIPGQVGGAIADPKNSIAQDRNPPGGVREASSEPHASKNDQASESMAAGGISGSDRPTGSRGKKGETQSRPPEAQDSFRIGMATPGSHSSPQASTADARVEGLANPGEVFERILNYLRDRQGLDPQTESWKELLADSSLAGRDGPTGEDPSSRNTSDHPSGRQGSEDSPPRESGSEGEASKAGSARQPERRSGDIASPLAKFEPRPGESTLEGFTGSEVGQESRSGDAGAKSSTGASQASFGNNQADLGSQDSPGNSRGASAGVGDNPQAVSPPGATSPSSSERSSSPSRASAVTRGTAPTVEEGARATGREPSGIPDRVEDQKTLPDVGRTSLEVGPGPQEPAARLDLPGKSSQTGVRAAETPQAAKVGQSPEASPAGESTASSPAPPIPQEANLPRAGMELPPTPQQFSGSPEALSPSISRHQSSAQGRQEGDRSGAGGAGGGQPSPQPGQGTPGSHSPSPSPSGNLASGAGGGELGVSPTPQAPLPASGLGGTARGESGRGVLSSARDQQGQTPTGEELGGDRMAGVLPIGGTGSPGERPADRLIVQRVLGGNPTQGGSTALGPGGQLARPQEPIYQPDEVNLAYAERATALVLEYLRSQVETGRADRELLETLGWTVEDLQRFYQEWVRLRQEAARGQSSAKDQYIRALRSLGLRPPAKTLGPTGGQGLGPRVKESQLPQPPPEWVEYFRAYRAGVARGN
jgi:hypothetical protein